MIDACYFLSDLHLGSDEEPKAFLLIEFLQKLKSREQITKLFLVGDVFDMWLAAHIHYQNRYQKVIAELARLKSIGVELHYFEGNHDMYLEHFFERQLGAKIYKGPGVFQLCGKRVRIEHGDQMDPDDYGYKALRWFWRTPVLKWLAPRLPERVIVSIGDNLSEASREYNSDVKILSDDRARQILRNHAQKIWSESPFDLLITGHTHVKDDYTMSPPSSARVINLGSWFDEPKAFFLNHERAEFVKI